MKSIQSNYLQPTQTILPHVLKNYVADTQSITKIQQSPTMRTIQLKPIQEEKPIVAIDVSSIKIGETKTGVLFAIRGAIVQKEKYRYKYQQIGPFPFHITEQNKNEIHKLIRKSQFEFSEVPNLVNIQLRMGNILERWLQLSVSCSEYDSIILWDGSMSARIADNPGDEVSRILDITRKHNNTVLAFTKNTNLRFLGYKLTDYAEKTIPPCLLQITDLPKTLGPILLLGNVYIAKLTSGVCSFRLDIDKKIPQAEGINAVQSLLSNDLLIQSYPETLRLAHIYSTFTATEVIGIQRFIAQQYGLRIITRPNVRRILFGPFGKGAEG